MSSLASPAQQQRARAGDAIFRYPDFAKVTQADFRGEKIAIFIHGFTAESSYMAELMQQFSGAGFTSLAFEYACFRGIDHAAKNLSQLLTLFDGEQTISGNRLVLVGHSMGGLVARALVALEGGSRFVRKVITLGSPHGGTLLDAKMLRYMAYWGEAIGGVNPRGFSPCSASAMQLLGADGPSPLIGRLATSCAENVEFFSISGGYAQLDFGKGFAKNFLINQYLQKRLSRPNDGLVSERSSDLTKIRFSPPAPVCTHVNGYNDYPHTNHTYLTENQSVALTAIQCAK